VDGDLGMHVARSGWLGAGESERLGKEYCCGGFSPGEVFCDSVEAYV
jgi:hypothetical protein